jgi:hypothetical protein
MKPSPPEPLFGTNSKLIFGQSDGLAERINHAGVIMSGWRPFGNVIIDDVWA